MSAGQPRSSKRRAISRPVKPAAMPRARVSTPREESSKDTLMPFPPGEKELWEKPLDFPWGQARQGDVIIQRGIQRHCSYHHTFTPLQDS